MRNTLLCGLVATAVVVLASAVPGNPPAGATEEPTVRPPHAVTVAAARAAATYAPVTRLLANDPRRRPHRISNAIVAAIDATPPGESIEVSTFWISSERIGAALRRAFRRGVQVRLIVARNVDPTPQTAALDRLLGADRSDRSWLVRSRTAARGPGGMMHEKTFRFSRAGDARWVTMTGSYNASDAADTDAYALMWQVVGRRDVYDAFDEVAAAQRSQRSDPRPLREYVGRGWSAYFLPMNLGDPAADPVVRRLAAIPARPSSEVRIAMFSMWGERGHWIGERLADMAQRGVRVSLVVGPSTDPLLVETLRWAGVRIHAGCFADGRYAHHKDMAASYVVRGDRVHWTWVGSDNWTSRGAASDQAVLGIAGRRPYEQFGRALTLVTGRDDGRYGSECQPRHWD